MQLLQLWLPIKQIHMRWGSVLEQHDDPFGLGREMGYPRKSTNAFKSVLTSRLIRTKPGEGGATFG